MPAGSDFICKNEKCEHCDKGIVVTGPWPLGDIDKILDVPNVAKEDKFREGLMELKVSGRTHACLVYPNVDDIDTVGYRIHRWCPNCPCLWHYDAMVQDENDTLEQTLSKTDIPENCTTCGTKLQSFNELVEQDGVGVDCPHCKEPMQKNTWFSNETTEEVR